MLKEIKVVKGIPDIKVSELKMLPLYKLKSLCNRDRIVNYAELIR